MSQPASPLTGLSAFPLTPMRDDAIDQAAFARLVARLAGSGVDSIAVLGSTGSYAYLSRDERRLALDVATAEAGDKPVIAGIGAVRASDVLRHAEDAHATGAAALLLAPVSYQPLSAEEVYDLFAAVDAAGDLPIIVYDNPATTGFNFTLELFGELAKLPRVASIKVQGLPADRIVARVRLEALRQAAPGLTIGLSGDWQAATGIAVGCDAWYSVIAGTLPWLALDLYRVSQQGAGRPAFSRLDPLWSLFREYGSLRVVAAIAEHLGLVDEDCLPRPLRGLPPAGRQEVAAVVERFQLRD